MGRFDEGPGPSGLPAHRREPDAKPAAPHRSGRRGWLDAARGLGKAGNLAGALGRAAGEQLVDPSMVTPLSLQSLRPLRHAKVGIVLVQIVDDLPVLVGELGDALGIGGMKRAISSFQTSGRR